MENDVIFERPIKGPSTKVLTRVVTKKRLGWASIGLSVLAFGTAIAAAGALAWYVTEGQVVSKQQAKEIKVVLKANEKDIQNKINFVPEQDEAKLQSALNSLGKISTVSKDLNKENTTFTDFFLAGSKMFGKGIANVNTKVESLWENFIDKHFGKVEKDASGVVQTTPLASKQMDGDKVAKTALDTLADTTGALDIKSNLYVGTTDAKKNLYVTGTTTTAGTSAFTGNVVIGSKTSSTTLEIFSDTTIGTTANKKDLTVSGTTTLRDTLTVDKTTTIGKFAAANPTPAELKKDTLMVKGASYLLGSTRIDSATISTTLEVLGISTFNDNIIAKKALTVTGATTLNGDTTIGTTANKKNLIVNGVTNLKDNVNISGVNLTISAATHMSGPLTVSGATTTLTNLIVNGTSTFREPITANKDLSVNGNTILGSSATSTLEVKATSTFDEPITAKKALTVTGATTLSDTLTVAKATTLSDTLAVTKATTLSDTLTVAKATTLSDTLTVAKATTLRDTLTVAKATTLSDTLTVAKATTLSDTLTVAKATTLSDTLTVAKATTLSDTLAVTKVTTLSDTLTVAKATTLSDTLTVAKKTTIGKFAANNPTANELNNDMLIVNGATTLNGNTILGSQATSTLEVKATSTFDESITAKKDLTVTGRTSLYQDTTIGRTTFPASLTVNGETTLGVTKIGVDKTGTTTTLKVYGDTTIGTDDNKKTLTVNGATTLKGNTAIGIPKSTTTMLGLINIGRGTTATYNENLVLHVQGASTLDGNVTIGELDSKTKTIQRNYTTIIYADTTIGASGTNANNKKNLTVYGKTDIKGLTTLGSTGDNHDLDRLKVYGKTTFDGDVVISATPSSSLKVYTNTEIGLETNNKTLTIYGDLIAKGSLKGFSFETLITGSITTVPTTTWDKKNSVELATHDEFKNGVQVMYTILFTIAKTDYSFSVIGHINTGPDLDLNGSFVLPHYTSGSPSTTEDLFITIKVRVHVPNRVSIPVWSIKKANGADPTHSPKLPDHISLLIRKI